MKHDLKNRCRRLFWLLGTCLLMMSVAHAGEKTATVQARVSMRDSGYTMGELLHMRAEVPLPSGAKLDEDSLPLVGRVKPWLDLRDIQWQQHGKLLTLDLTWQLFATVEIAQQLHTPEVVLKTADKTPLALVIAPQSFYYSPVLPHPLKEVKRRANLPPFAFDEYTPRRAAFTCLALAIGLLLLWLWFKDRLPWLPYRPGPLTRLAREMRRWPQGELQPAQLQAIHAALNQAAGQSLYPHTLPVLFERSPCLRSEEAAIRGFFMRSWQAIHQNASAQIQAEAARSWVQQAALAERLFRRRQA